MKKDVGEGNPSTLRFDIVCSAYVADVLFRQVTYFWKMWETVRVCFDVVFRYVVLRWLF